MLIGEKIRVIRESEDLTREEFCGLIDVPIGTLRRYETGRIENIGGWARKHIVFSKIPQDWYTARLIMERWGHGGLVTLGFHE